MATIKTIKGLPTKKAAREICEAGGLAIYEPVVFYRVSPAGFMSLTYSTYAKDGNAIAPKIAEVFRAAGFEVTVSESKREHGRTGQIKITQKAA